MFVVGKIDGMEVVGKFKGERIDSILRCGTKKKCQNSDENFI